MTQETIRIMEVTRRLPEGTYTYVIHKGRVLRRLHRRGRPSYEVVHPIEITSGDQPESRDVNVNSQVGRAVLAQLEYKGLL